MPWRQEGENRGTHIRGECAAAALEKKETSENKKGCPNSSREGLFPSASFSFLNANEAESRNWQTHEKKRVGDNTCFPPNGSSSFLKEREGGNFEMPPPGFQDTLFLFLVLGREMGGSNCNLIRVFVGKTEQYLQKISRSKIRASSSSAPEI